MKQKLYLAGIISFMLIVLGVIFKMLHFPTSGILLSTGFIGIVFIFFPLGMLNAWRNEEQKVMKPLYIATYLTILVVFTSMVFKIMHWPGAGKMLMIALPFPFIVFLPAFLYSSSRVPGYSVHRVVLVMLILTYMSVFNALLALNVTKERLDDSLLVASAYARTYDLREAPVYQANNEGGTIFTAADDLLLLLEEAETKIIEAAGAKKGDLKNNINSIGYLGSTSITSQIMFEGEPPALGTRLDEAVDRLVTSAGTIGNRYVTGDVMNDLLLFGPEDYPGQTWSEHLFSGTWTSWSLVYIEMLKSNIILIRNELEIEIDL